MSDRAAVTDLADAMRPVPIGDDAVSRYASAAARAALFVGSQAWWDKGETISKALFFRSAVDARIRELNSVVSVAVALGQPVVENPFVTVARLEQTITRAAFEQVTWSDAVIMTIAADVRRLSKIADDIMTGALVPLGGPGMSSFTAYPTDVTVDGASIAAAQTEALLGRLDFSHRRPRVVCTVERPTVDGRPGCLVVWRRMPDIDFVRVTRVDVIDDVAVVRTLTRTEVDDETRAQADYLSRWVLPFYPSLSAQELSVFWDQDVTSHSMFTYTILGLQTNRALQDVVPSGKIVVVQPTADLIARVLKRIRASAPLIQSVGRNDLERVDISAVSFYPSLAAVIVGDEMFDWVLAAATYRAATAAGLADDVRRSVSLVGASGDVLTAVAAGGLLRSFEDVTAAAESYTAAVARVGVQRAVAAVLSSVGVLDSFGGDALSELLSRVDPETAMYSRGTEAIFPTTTIRGADDTLIADAAATDDIVSGDPAQYVDRSSVGSLVDLSTPRGLGVFLRDLFAVAR
ncbi:MAG: hypothetical protein A3E78_10390 [Alphaproteobacteria bacterium RIFCSPHIGHO2_12_FULL_63_12]|nr:MAG: hypothetical protein A3E78_10390 [Alphaproteobacteria bacterium RIFCSPHIGHO2_12_FULL_63_12]